MRWRARIEPAEEFALYDQLLRELAAKASGVPVGATPASARSAAYTQVLDKYLSRLAELNRPLDALRVYRTEIDRNPNDPGLYERLAAFLEQNGTAREVEEVYTKAIGKFADRSWYHKLARWYLRKKEYSALEKISRDVIAAFSGTELEGYFGDIVSQTHPDAALYRQLNRYAHARFPEDLVFVHNLLGAYAAPGNIRRRRGRSACCANTGSTTRSFGRRCLQIFRTPGSLYRGTGGDTRRKPRNHGRKFEPGGSR